MRKPVYDDYLPRESGIIPTHPDVHTNFWAKVILAHPKPEPDESDYFGDDGLIYCGHCNTPRQMLNVQDNIFRGMILPIACACRKAKESEKETDRFENRVRLLRREAFTSPAMLEWRFEKSYGSSKHMDTAQRYVRKWEEIREQNIGLYLWGDVGVGKSFLAGCIANGLIDRGVAVKMASFPELLADLKVDFDHQAAIVRDLCSYPLLILDDFGIERWTEYVQELLFALIDGRARSRKPLIITSNLPYHDLESGKGSLMQQRIFDRIRQMCHPIEIDGESRRALEARAREFAFSQVMQE